MLSFDVSEGRFYGTAGQPGEFPNGKHVDFPLNEDVRRFYRHGPLLLQRYPPLSHPFVAWLTGTIRHARPQTLFRLCSGIVSYSHVQRVHGRCIRVQYRTRHYQEATQ